MRDRRARGFTLQELMASICLLSLLVLFLGDAVLFARRWKTSVETVATLSFEELTLRAQLLELGGTGPVSTLSLGARGELVEGALPGAIESWGPPSLVVRNERGYVVLGVEKEGLVKRRIAPLGISTHEVIFAGARRATFRVVRSDERATGIEYLVEAPGKSFSGIVALRVDRTPGAPLEAPRLEGPR